MSTSRTRKLINRKRRIQYRLRHREWAPQDRPMFTASNIHYELADKRPGLGRRAGSGRCTCWPGGSG